MTFAASTTLHRWLFCDVERPLRFAPVAAFDRLFSRQWRPLSPEPLSNDRVRSACSAVTTLTGMPNRSMP